MVFLNIFSLIEKNEMGKEINIYLVSILGHDIKHFMLFLVIIFVSYTQSSFRAIVNKKKMDFISTYIFTVSGSLHFFM